MYTFIRFNEYPSKPHACNLAMIRYGRQSKVFERSVSKAAYSAPSSRRFSKFFDHY